MCNCGSAAAASRLSILCGALSLATLFTAFVSNVWLFTSEPVRLPNSDQPTTVSFRIGLWRVCPSVSKPNTSRHVPSPACSLVKYSSWGEVTHSDLGIWTALDFTPAFLTRMRYAMPFLATSLVILLLATMFAFLGHCSEDHRTLVAVGLYTLGGLSLGGSLVVFVSMLSDAYLECPEKPTALLGSASYTTSSLHYDYQYGWSFFTAGSAVILAELAALLAITAFFRRLSVLQDVTGFALPSDLCDPDYIASHTGARQQTRLLNGPASIWRSEDEVESKPASPSRDAPEGVPTGPLLLSDAEPDVCRSNPARMASPRQVPVRTCKDPSTAPDDRQELAAERRPLVVGVTVPIRLARPLHPAAFYGEHVNVFATLPRNSAARTQLRTAADDASAYSTLQPRRGRSVTVSTFSSATAFELTKSSPWTNSEV